MTDNISDVNLSEVLFKPRNNYIETSLISNSGCELPDQGDGHHLMGSHFRSLWYRPLNLFTWAYLGANSLDLEEALANIVMSENPRTRENCFDTVEQYGSGNWIYEFSSIAQARVQKARLKEQEPETPCTKMQISHQYRMASRYFAIAAYPNLKGDVLAAQSALLGRMSYRKIFNDVEHFGYYAEETFTVRGEKVTGFLHYVSNTEMQPCVIVLSSYANTSTDYYRLFSDYLRKLGIAIFVVDMPGMGASEKVTLDAQCSDILENAIQHLQEKVPYIDSSAIGALGFNMGANAIVRLSLIKPNLFKAVALVSPALHSFFVNQEGLNSLPLAMRSALANRLDLDASSWDTIVPQLQRLSLKKQGLITYSSKINTDCFVLFMPRDLKYDNDGDMIDGLFPHKNTVSLKKVRVSEMAPKIFSNIANFFASKLK